MINKCLCEAAESFTKVRQELHLFKSFAAVFTCFFLKLLAFEISITIKILRPLRQSIFNVLKVSNTLIC